MFSWGVFWIFLIYCRRLYARFGGKKRVELDCWCYWTSVKIILIIKWPSLTFLCFLCEADPYPVFLGPSYKEKFGVSRNRSSFLTALNKEWIGSQYKQKWCDKLRCKETRASSRPTMSALDLPKSVFKVCWCSIHMYFLIPLFGYMETEIKCTCHPCILLPSSA